MGTAEMMIVFSALMALIALVTIGIDWIGKPLKHRRFIPRIYRFDDEKLPVDEYGNTTFVSELDEQQPPLLAMYQPGPQPMASPQAQHHPMAQPLASAMLPTQSTEAERTVAIAAQPSPRPVATIDSDVAASATASRSAFTDSLAVPKAAQPTPSDANSLQLPDHALIAGTAGATPSTATSTDLTWTPDMPLDTTIDDQKPSLAIKAERFWMASAEAAHGSHFDADDIDQMASGKAPRRTNPRTGRTEAMQLTGLRQASVCEDVRMRWPDESVDPWSAS